MDIHGIFYVSKAQMIEKLPSDDEAGEAMETQPGTEADGNVGDIQNGDTDVVKVNCIMRSVHTLICRPDINLCMKISPKTFSGANDS